MFLKIGIGFYILIINSFCESGAFLQGINQYSKSFVDQSGAKYDG